ncbi:MAG: apolipoprotein N-acyltransferase [Holosporaceae bacterium]|jgi:apolipoprotein N-acyltransferase|nr:apolipoprotein N-acyltransferase [Holosporaceae bacterium]
MTLIHRKISKNVRNRRFGSGLRSYGRYFLAGASAALGFAPFQLSLIFLLSFGWFFAKIIAEDQWTDGNLVHAFVFLIGLHMAGLYWLAFPLTVNFARHWILMPPAVILIPAWLSLQLLPAVFIAKRYCRGIYEKALTFAALFCAGLFFLGHYGPGFPWILPGYIWSCHEIFLQTLSIYGIYGLTFITVWLSGLMGCSYVFHRKKDLKNRRKSLQGALFLMLSLTIFGFVRLQGHGTEFTQRSVRLVQCNISQKDKMDQKLSYGNLRRHVDLSRHDARVDFIIWPEASIPYLYHEQFAQLHEHLKSPLKIGEYLIAGAVRKDLPTSNVYNSAVVVDHRGENICNYDKIRLVAFGEYLPLRKYIPFLGLQSIASEIGDFDVGGAPKLLEINGLRMVMAICYEAAFPLEFIPAGQRGDVIVNLTNDGWFGPTSEPFQHLQIVRARAIETGLPLIRATNYGISAVFDPLGREIGRIAFNRSGFLDCRIPTSIPETPYGKFGDLLFFVFLMISLIYAFRRGTV